MKMTKELKKIDRMLSNVRYINWKYSIENLSNLWDKFCLKTRSHIIFSDKQGIDINKFFGEQTDNARMKIVKAFKHFGVDIFIDLDKDEIKLIAEEIERLINRKT